MKIIRIALIVLLAGCIFAVKVQAQSGLLNSADISQVNVDNYSDDQLVAMLKKANDSGISETQLYKLLADKGLPDSEITKLKARLAFLGSKTGAGPQNPDTTTRQANKEFNHPYDTATNYLPVEKFKNDETIFGSELFTQNSLVFEPNLRIPAPAGYVLGPGDEIVISVFGYSEQKYDVTLDDQGDIYIPNAGPILLNGLTMEKATEKIKSTLASTIYRAISSGRTKVQVSLGKIKSIRITVIGQAKKPGTFTVSSLTTLFNALYLCGGPTPLGSYRAIEVIRGNNITRTADLYHFLVNGIQQDNILLQEGDVIRIPYYKKRVKISGNVKREGKFEMLDSENFNDLLTYCGGFTDDAYRGAVSVTRITDTAKKIIDLPALQFNDFQPKGSDEYVVSRLQDIFSNRVFIAGAVNRPGPYQLSNDITVNDLINKAGGLTQDAYTERVTIFRARPNKMPTTMSIDLDSIQQYNQKIYLQKDDSLYIHSIFEYSDHEYIKVEGSVRKPGEIPWRDHFSLNDLLLSVGGLSESGDSSNIEISRRIRNANIDQAVHDESTVFNVDLGDEKEPQNQIFLQPYDIVIVKTLPGYTTQRVILVQGEVKSPGKYSLIKTGDRISDIISRTGGLKASADSNSITIRRITKTNLSKQEKEGLFQRVLDINPDSLAQNPRLKGEIYSEYDLISVDLATALAHPESPGNLALDDGDILSVNRSSNLVKVSGEVYFPTIVAYKPNENLKYYVQQAGNFTAYARKSGALVIYPDGKAASVKHFLWIKTYPSVTPRSEIYVPQKEKNNRQRLSVAELALLVSSLGIMINVLKL